MMYYDDASGVVVSPYDFLSLFIALASGGLASSLPASGLKKRKIKKQEHAREEKKKRKKT